MRNLPVDETSLFADIAVLAKITEPDRPFTRRAFSPMFLKGRNYLALRMEKSGLKVRIDAAGNLIGRREGRDPAKKAIVIGSHSDTVPDGGRFDGIAGVAAGLEIARTFEQNGTVLEHPFEVIDCLAEEVSIFGLSCIGSRAIAGELEEDWLARTEPDGETLAAAIGRMGGDASRLIDARRDDIAAFLELHIEQGPVLEHEKTDIGIVTGIAGITRVEFTIAGRADHAGTTPMEMRQDALVGAARLILHLREVASKLAASGQGHFVATVGEIRAEPNAANVVPAKVTLLADIRAENRTLMDAFLTALPASVEALLASTGVRLERLTKLSDAMPALSNGLLLSELEAATGTLGLTHRRMASGAGHDMAWFSRIAPSAMIFVPCLGGRSHTPDEWATSYDLAAGAAVIHDAVLRLDKILP